MDRELLARCNDLDDARDDTRCRADMRRKKLWAAAYALRGMDVPHMVDEEVDVFAELAFLSMLPAYRHVTLVAYSTSLQHVSDEHKRYFAHLVKLANRMDTHGDEELATDADWHAWMESM